MNNFSVIGRLADFVRRYTLLRRIIILTWHVIGTGVSYYLAFYLRFDGQIPAAETGLMFRTLPLLLAVNILTFSLFHLHSGMWSFFSLADLTRVFTALGTATLLFVAGVFSMLHFSFFGYPRAVFIIYVLLMIAWMVGARLIIRIVREHRAIRPGGDARNICHVLVVGLLDNVEDVVRAWDSGDGDIRAIVTDESSAHNLTVRGVPVFGPVADIGRLGRRLGANRVLILPPYTRPKQIAQIVENCEKSGLVCTFQMIPSMSDMASGRVELSSTRKVELEDLLGRPEISFNRKSVKEAMGGKVVMITGAGGSIGSELARQVAHYAPKHLVLFDNSEFNLYTVDMELRQNMPKLSFSSVAGDICHSFQVEHVLKKFGVQIIYHAAAYKHVPIMEQNVSACILNNVVGTARLAEQAEKCAVERFVLISSDKAVRPTSVMGASKRLAERLIHERTPSNIKFVIVRFGNVLGSSGSVVPLFRKQIEAGGPVTVTTPDITRFFMSIPEAVDLVLQAGLIGNDRDVMVLEMGQPVKVADMAKRLIELSGLRVGDDIEIVYTGIRPGEKEFEELMTDNENVVRTPFDKIWVMKETGSALPSMDLELLAQLAETHDEGALRRDLMRLIPDAYPLVGTNDTKN